MNKIFRKYAACWLIALIVFNVICFVTPGKIAGVNKFTGTFWVGYVFITVAFIGQLLCTYIAFRADSAKQFFNNIPLISVSYTGLVVMLAAGGLAMAVPFIPEWVGVVICLIILAVTAVSVIKGSAAADAVQDVDRKVKTQTMFLKSLTAEAEGLMACAKTPEAKEACRKVYEAIRYSDPVSDEALTGIESQITLKFNVFSDAVVAGSGNTGAVADELVVLIGDRNKKCKLLK